MDEIENLEEIHDALDLQILRRAQSGKMSILDETTFFGGFSDKGIGRLMVASRKAYEARKRERFGDVD